MKNALRIIVVFTAVCAAAQITFNNGPGAMNPPRDKGPQPRLLTGQVMNAGDRPLANAIVYLKNSKTQAVKTYIADNNGMYRFPSLAPNIDFEIFAEYRGKRSDTKTLSSFDNRTQSTINLRIDTGQ
jgi:hypothetical protein